MILQHIKESTRNKVLAYGISCGNMRLVSSQGGEIAMLIASKPFLSFLAIPFITFVILLTSGCVGGPPTQEELARADYGTPISQEDAQRQALEFLKGALINADSAKIDWSPVRSGWLREARGLKFGYILDLKINAKNSDGAYIGYKPYRFMFFNGTIVNVYAERELGTGNDRTTYMGKIY